MAVMAESTTPPELLPGTDQRLAKGARARAAIARHAVEVASVEGLTGVSIGRLAADLGLSKSGIATLFGTKEALQVAAVKSAREAFIERVIAPSMSQPRGYDRLRVLIELWFEHITDPTFPGGCFRVATIAEFDSKPGPVRDAIAEDRRDWLAFLAKRFAGPRSKVISASATRMSSPSKSRPCSAPPTPPSRWARTGVSPPLVPSSTTSWVSRRADRPTSIGENRSGRPIMGARSRIFQ